MPGQILRSNTPRIDDVLTDNPDVLVSHNEYVTMRWFEKNGLKLGYDFSLQPETHTALFARLTPAKRDASGSVVLRIQ